MFFFRNILQKEVRMSVTTVRWYHSCQSSSPCPPCVSSPSMSKGVIGCYNCKQCKMFSSNISKWSTNRNIILGKTEISVVVNCVPRRTGGINPNCFNIQLQHLEGVISKQLQQLLQTERFVLWVSNVSMTGFIINFIIKEGWKSKLFYASQLCPNNLHLSHCWVLMISLLMWGPICQWHTCKTQLQS